MNKIIILENNGGRMANQLWQFAVIYAFCLENNYRIDNYAFFRYWNLFNIPAPKNRFVNLVFFKFYGLHNSLRLNKILYAIFAFTVKLFFPGKSIDQDNMIYLSKADGSAEIIPEKIANFRNIKNGTLYISGWNFRHPIALVRYQKEIGDFFKPKKELVVEVVQSIAELRKKHKKIVGIHIRHGDYRVFENGRYFFSSQEVREIIDDFLSHQADSTKIFFVICSDEKIEEQFFEGLNFRPGFGSAIKDLHALSLTDLVISSTSTFGQWSSYVGGVNIINFSRNRIDWDGCFERNVRNNPWLSD